VVADLPASGVFAPNAYGEPLFPQSREHIYMLWQTRHRASTVNGLNGYLPKARIDLQRALDRVPEPSALDDLERAGVRYLVFHRRMVLPTEVELFPRLRDSPELHLVLDNADVSIFELRADSLRP
jgi:hypothetical protein